MSVEVGQVWSLLNDAHARYAMQVKRIAGGMAHGVSSRTGRPVTPVRVVSLSRGYRGAHLEREADGRAPYRPPIDKGQHLVTEERSASQLVRKVKPRGIAKVSDRKQKAYKLVRERGWSVNRTAAKFGVRPGLVSQWLREVDEAIFDARMIGKAS